LFTLKLLSIGKSMRIKKLKIIKNKKFSLEWTKLHAEHFDQNVFVVIVVD